MDKHQFRKLIYTQVDQLPTLPAALPRLLALMGDRNAGAGQIVEAISTDPALTSKILQAANSAYYGFSKTIANLERAVPLLGLNMVKSLALTMGVLRSLPAGRDDLHFSSHGLWTHSLAVATAVNELGKRLRLETEYLFTLGLLHDVGKVVLFHYFPEMYIEVLEEAVKRQGEDLALVEREVMGLDHGEVGQLLLKRWKFPDLIAGPIGVHHHDHIPDRVDEVDVALLQAADHAALASGVGAAGNPRVIPLPESVFQTLEIRPEQVEELVQFMKGKAEEITALYHAMR